MELMKKVLPSRKPVVHTEQDDSTPGNVRLKDKNPTLKLVHLKLRYGMAIVHFGDQI